MSEKILYYDCFSGISGDMNLAAMVDLGVPEEYLRSELAKLGLEGYELRFTPDSKNGIHGTRADVDVGMSHRGHAHHDHHHDDQHGHDHHEHRSFKDIRSLIQASSLSSAVKGIAVGIFTLLAEAEGAIHDQRAEDVQFHEVGAVDSIVDMVGAAICLDFLKPDKVLASSVELGGGFVKCQHGLIPVPAPAVVSLLSGAPVKSGAVNFETTTPTGAAILMATVDEFTDDRRFIIEKTAYGVGHRDMEIPNLLRLFLGKREPTTKTETSILLECNIDDMSAELHGHIFDLAFAAGASDVWISPIMMKKGRSAITLSVLTPSEAEGEISRIIFTETTSLGMRRSEVGKLALERELAVVSTSLGDVRVKKAFLDGRQIRVKAEYEDMRRIAAERGMSLLDVESRIGKEIG